MAYLLLGICKISALSLDILAYKSQGSSLDDPTILSIILQGCCLEDDDR
jgi:hypothetical protein